MSDKQTPGYPRDPLTDAQRAKIREKILAGPPMTDDQIERVALILAASRHERRAKQQ